MTENEVPVNGEPEVTEEVVDEVEEKDYDELTPMEQFFFHQRRALEETRKALETMLPPGFADHSSEAGREFAKGFRVLVDAAIDELKKVSEKAENEEEGEEGDDDSPSTTGKTKVKVQVD